MREGGRAYSPGVGWLTILNVDVVRLEQLTDADARADGFETLAAMRRVLAEIYPDLGGDGRQWFRVAFKPEAGERPSEQGKLS